MIIHLEYGICTQGLDKLTLNAKAAECYEWKHFVVAEFRDELLEEIDLDDEYSSSVCPFKCPSCDKEFTKLSGLFQHADSRVCNASLSSGVLSKLVRWFDNTL